MGLYAVGYNYGRCFCSAEPLGPNGDPYPQMFGSPPAEVLDSLTEQSARYFYEREEKLLTVDPSELKRSRKRLGLRSDSVAGLNI